ncbi:MAG: glycyl-radical enzyme activating protein [Desulfovibrionales bacterium]|nr:glycyl-radical enzyme activating protein [Desulfovibrionales bacterium]
MTMTSTSGTLFAIKRYAVHDGPDLRVTIFFKGCPLSCLWCHNPEGMDFSLEILTRPEKCVACGDCVPACPDAALSLGPAGPMRDTSCTLCGHCAEICPALAHEAVGQIWTLEAVLAEIRKELPFFQGTQGGVTFSGGEPLAQPDFLHALLVACGQEAIHRAVDTSGHAPWPVLERIARHVDLFLYDLKHMDPHVHKQMTGVENSLILDNLTRLASSGAQIVVRVPLIAHITDTPENLARTADFVAGLPGVRSCDLLPYHGLAQSKYAKLGRAFPGTHLVSVSQERIAAAGALFTQRGLCVRIGG